MDEAYYKLAVWLNDKGKIEPAGVSSNLSNRLRKLSENYRLQSKYENHLIAKVALFQFVNSFLSLFYIAFYLRDQDKLKEVILFVIDAGKTVNWTYFTATCWFAYITSNYRKPSRVGMAILSGAVEAG